MKKNKLLPYIVAIIIFYALSYSYFSPLLEGKVIKGSDDLTAASQQQAIHEHHDKYKEWPKWTDAMFSGMPSTIIFAPNPGDLIGKSKSIIQRLLGIYPAIPLIVMMLGFFFLLRVLKVDPWLSIAGAVGYGFTTFFFILIPTGHLTQTYAIAYIAPLIASVIVAYQYNRWLGSALVAVFASFELSSQHPQMAYYAVLILVIFVTIYFIRAIKEKKWKKFLITSVVILFSGVLALGTHMNMLYPQYEYQKHSIRSASELTGNSENMNEGAAKSGSGLDYDYATSWSYGIDETLNILIPNLKGGGGSDYWGEQPFTAGPTYIGAIILFLFILSLFLLSGPVKWWLIVTTLLSIFLSWGNSSLIFDFFFYNVPLFNKFRNPAWALIIATLTIPLGAMLGLQKIISKDFLKEKVKKQILYAFAIVGGICLLFWVAPGLAGNFEKNYEGQDGQVISEHIVNAQQYARQTGKPFNQQLINAFEKVQDDLVQKRKEALKNDAMRSFFLILVSFLAIYLFLSKKGFKKGYFVLFIGVMILIDLWGINKRFISDDHFSRKKKEYIKPYAVNNIIEQIEKGKRNFRVLDLTLPLDQDSHTPYFHPSLGGYNAAKLRRYQELIDNHLMNEFNILRSNIQQHDSVFSHLHIMNMLNTKYVIYNNDSPPIANPYRMGDGWFVNNVVWANNADEEMDALGNLNPSERVVINTRFKDEIKFDSQKASKGNGSISISSYKMDNIVYDVTVKGNSLAIFPEIFYPDWHAYVDGKEVPVFQCNYVLRGIEVPDGIHKVEFKYIASEFKVGSAIAYGSSLVIIGILIVFIFFSVKGLSRKNVEI